MGSLPFVVPMVPRDDRDRPRWHGAHMPLARPWCGLARPPSGPGGAGGGPRSAVSGVTPPLSVIKESSGIELRRRAALTDLVAKGDKFPRDHE